ncbi:hypothetical protein QP866_06645 [Corynebacterium imitans]|uniref:hypothetical protein n=1 Tax=Corynebacterium imitans TaxID=156978 RepID=UPI00254A683F|nr:hypothetical protein [Corynebacterium imitans]MDK8637504.1 hypothetical protein [Corynebacterium imitans]MDK8772066.1 hypothetical protein [Corynebacterium imitans]
MRYRLRPSVLDAASEMTGAETDDELAHELRRSVSTVRNWRSGRTAPDVAGLMQLVKLTGIPVGEMLSETAETAAA